MQRNALYQIIQNGTCRGNDEGFCARRLRFSATAFLEACAAYRFRVPFFLPAFLAAAAFASCPFL
jgi:hypothetical protein